jgi:adenine-specific DNA-methyltransferase
MATLFQQDWREVWEGLDVPASGTVYTKPDIVELLLDLAGYTVAAGDLLDRRLLEPSCGDGAFLAAILRRLLASARLVCPFPAWDDPRWDLALTAVDINPAAVAASRTLIRRCLLEQNCPKARADDLAARWAFQTDFLLHDWERQRFDVVVGNPPYVRLEDMPPRVLRVLRDLWRTATDRADLYIPFFECGLSLLTDRGALAFICANRFAKNQYGAALRKLIAQHYHVRHYINLEHTQPFEQEVSAYPALLVIDRRRGAPTHAATVEDLFPATLDGLRQADDAPARASVQTLPLLHRFDDWYADGGPWISTSRTRRNAMAALARDYPTIEESKPGTKIGIGIATGADDIFILPGPHPGIEASRQVPLVMAGDIRGDAVTPSGQVLINPFSDEDDGRLAEFRDYPGFAAYLKAQVPHHRPLLARPARHPETHHPRYPARRHHRLRSRRTIPPPQRILVFNCCRRP